MSFELQQNKVASLPSTSSLLDVLHAKAPSSDTIKSYTTRYLQRENPSIDITFDKTFDYEFSLPEPSKYGTVPRKLGLLYKFNTLTDQGVNLLDAAQENTVLSPYLAALFKNIVITLRGAYKIGECKKPVETQQVYATLNYSLDELDQFNKGVLPLDEDEIEGKDENVIQTATIIRNSYKMGDYFFIPLYELIPVFNHPAPISFEGNMKISITMTSQNDARFVSYLTNKNNLAFTIKDMRLVYPLIEYSDRARNEIRSLNTKPMIMTYKDYDVRTLKISKSSSITTEYFNDIINLDSIVIFFHHDIPSAGSTTLAGSKDGVMYYPYGYKNYIDNTANPIKHVRIKYGDKEISHSYDLNNCDVENNFFHYHEIRNKQVLNPIIKRSVKSLHDGIYFFNINHYFYDEKNVRYTPKAEQLEITITMTSTPTTEENLQVCLIKNNIATMTNKGEFGIVVGNTY